MFQGQLLSLLTKTIPNKIELQAFLNFYCFYFHNFLFNTVYDTILFSSLLVLLSNLDLRGLCIHRFFLCVPTLTA